MAKEKRAHGPPTKKIRGNVEDVKPKTKAKGVSTGAKFSLRIKGSPGPGRAKGKGKEREREKVQGQKRRKPEDEDDDEEDDEDDDEDDEDDDEDTPIPKPKLLTKKSKAPLPTSFKIVAGSYEKLLYGLEGSISISPSPNSSSPYTYTLTPIFIFPAHVSCIKAVAASPEGGKWLATGSADEIVKVWDLRRRKEIGGLMHHEGSITHLVFPSRSHLLSASEDGTLCLFRARDWGVLRTLKGHKGRVNCVAVHPTGKIALSVGTDKALRMWDLMRGRGSASTKLGKEGEIVCWSTDGALFAVQSGSIIDIFNTGMELLHTIKHPSRLHDLRFCKRVVGAGELLLATAEDKLVSVYDISAGPESTPRIIATMTGHTNRVKAVQTLDIALPLASSSSSSTQQKSTTIACTVSSDGLIHVYDLSMVPVPEGTEKVVEIAPVASYDTKGTRLTCLTLADGDVVTGEAKVGEKRKEREGEEDEEEESEQEEMEWPSEQEEEEREGEEEIESD